MSARQIEHDVRSNVGIRFCELGPILSLSDLNMNWQTPSAFTNLSSLTMSLPLYYKVACSLTILTLYHLINHFNPLNPTGPHADQNMGVSETRVVCMQTSQEMFTYPTGLHVDHRINGLVYSREPSSYYFNFLLCDIVSVALIRPKIPQN